MTPAQSLSYKLSGSAGTSGHFEALKEKIETGTARVGILGLGYVGLPLACAFAKHGFVTTGFEVDPDKAARISRGDSYIDDIPQAALKELTREGKLRATTDFSHLAQQDAIIICVPTPLRKSKDPDVSYIAAAAQQIQKSLRPGQLIILESTTYPGTTREMLLPAFTSPGFELGREFFLAFSPERVDPGNKQYKIHNTPKVVGGMTPFCLDLSVSLYGKVVETVFPVSSVEAAEMAKLLENTFRAVNIAMINEVAMMCQKLGIRASEVIDAAKTKPFGFMPFYPGPGIGGHCIPLDPHYLAWKMRTLDFEPRFIELAGAINSHMPEFVVERTADILNRAGRALSQSTVLVLGVAYKKDVSDMRESPALAVIEQLQAKSARVVYHDPYVPLLPVGERMLSSVSLEDPQTLAMADLTLILTDHSSLDYSRVAQHSRLVFDTRNVLKGSSDPKVFCL